MELTPSELTVLGLVVEQPRHGYDLERVIEERGVRQWTDIGFSSIYYVLTKLGKRGLVAADQGRTGSRSRRVFHATGHGRQVAADAALAFISGARAAPHPILVGLANLPLVAERDYGEALNSRLAQLDARIRSVMDAERLQGPLPYPAHEVFSFSLALLEAERSWLAARVRTPDD